MRFTGSSAEKKRAVLVGLGQIGLGYAMDPRTAKYFAYATHAQVLSEHPRFEWVGACDRDPETVAKAKQQWPELLVTEQVASLRKVAPEVLVLATGPANRLEVIRELPSLQAVLTEKPLGLELDNSTRLLNACKQRMLTVQVNLWRRAEKTMRQLAEGGLKDLIGHPQATHVLYGRGIRNNGTHLIDACRMLFGEPTNVQAISHPQKITSPGVSDDYNLAFAMQFGRDHTASFTPLDFAKYRENSIEIWGTKGRIAIRQEGLSIQVSQLGEHRAITGENEIVTDQVSELEQSCGHALFDMYTNLADAIDRVSSLWSPIEETYRTQQLVELVLDSAARGGSRLGWERCKSNYRRAS